MTQHDADNAKVCVSKGCGAQSHIPHHGQENGRQERNEQTVSKSPYHRPATSAGNVAVNPRRGPAEKVGNQARDDDAPSPGFLPVSEALQKVLTERGYTMMFMESGHDGQSEQKTFEKMLAYNPAAIIQFNIDTIESCTQLLANVDVPILEIGALNTHPVGMCIGVDYGKAVKQLVTHLADASLKNIALLCTPANNTMFRQLLSGWNTAMLALNRSPHRVVTTHLPSTIATGVNIFKDMMITWGDLDALICTSDEMACGCMMACHSAGIKVPNTVAIASLGGGVLSTVCSPALTTVEFPWHDIGVKAGKALLELLNDKPGEKFIEIPSVLKVRASTAA
ncbi:LacI family transcriptional regulator [Klebsiella pneumoniae]|nr:LacI family transcriptional regulator [Klebsiella pneumoniae]VGC18449.1 LacI family transcriptional regulator [Klebsiella pneumoniae]VGG87282.1 LacI family transcriptional regulator [Klebsiella pneumoniae]VGH17871.1 LacI family transcriptional regulator [Klebsiella pneumoniae]VGK03351.1 LacI family transcriptional regulator [Klebsiella pneumoniae]